MREHLVDYYGRRRLRPEVLSRLRSLAAGTGRSAAPDPVRPSLWNRQLPPWVSSRWVLTAGACAFFLTIFFVSSRLDLPHGRDRGASALAQAVAAEIARNHNKRLNVEFRAAAFDALERQMGKLEFSLLEPLRVKQRGLRLIGARYCSIQGQPAAQLRLQDKDGRPCTLYESAAVPALAGVPETQVEVNGVRVELWQESGLLMGLAGPPGDE
ncbi:MAG: hypothetical protein HY927_04595 [Elusimicrobia bacterium]|nr:hypothetical protein [Elusimicrobiota bacterium]